MIPKRNFNCVYTWHGDPYMARRCSAVLNSKRQFLNRILNPPYNNDRLYTSEH